MDYRSEHIKNYRKYLPDLMETPGFYEYAIQVFNYLEMMEHRKILNLQADDPVKLQWLRVTVGAFITSSDHWMEYEINDDWSKIRKTDMPEEFKVLIRKWKVDNSLQYTP
jgi:hypothetical protein